MKHLPIIILTIAMLFTSCNSVRKTYERDLMSHFRSSDGKENVLTLKHIEHLPEPVRRYFITCGFIGQPVPMNAEVVWEESYIKMAPGKKWMELKTLQYNSVDEPFRIAYMKARMFGVVPFEGRDIYTGGQGHMFGKVANLITVFDERQREIGQSALLVILAEALLVPGYALADYITWEPIDDHSARARLVHKGYDVSGVFHFNETGELIRFETADRYYMNPDKQSILTPFSAEMMGYKQQGNFRIPTEMVAVWHLEQGRYEYWKGKIKEVRYNISTGGLPT